MQSNIKLENVYLDYILKTGSSSIRKFCIQSIKKALRQPLDHTFFNSSFRALDNINLNINKGDKIGILGRNGAGKSTLLRVLAGIYRPNIGKVTSDGIISSLFDVTLGLNPEASGYENIETMCVLKGINKTRIKTILKDVKEFTELGDFLANPVRMYSSGMSMKLAFGVATAGNPDILLVDEVIGVGDSKFMQKATSRIEKLMHNSNILVLTSHDINVIKKFCNKAIVLEQGKIVYNGFVDNAIKFYNDILFSGQTNHHEILDKQILTTKNLETEIT